MRLLANLDCEARWSGVALPRAVLDRISLVGTLFAACAPDGEHDLWLPSAVAPGRLLAAPAWTPPRVHTGAPAGVDLAWADPDARAVNDRSATLALATELGVALPGARTVASLADIDAAATDAPWICKARWTAAGRDRVRGLGAPAGEQRSALARLLQRHGPLVMEPWLDRTADFGVCGVAGDDLVLPPHQLRSDARGGFVGIELAPVPAGIADELTIIARHAARHLAARAYRGPFSVDAFTYRTPAGERLHPLCELNARHTFGWIAHHLARRMAIRRLGFDAAPPGATLLIAPAADRVTAWVS